MEAQVTDDPVLSRFRAAVDDVYGGRVERVVLFGSRARGDARPDSDYDIAVFLRDLTDRPDAMDQLADTGTDILYDAGRVIHAMPYMAGSYQERTPLMRRFGRTVSTFEPRSRGFPGEIAEVSCQGRWDV